MLNNKFVHARSATVARRVMASSPDELTEQVQLAWRLVLGREPDESETALAIKHVELQRTRFVEDAESLALASLCHVLLNSNEFLYVD